LAVVDINDRRRRNIQARGSNVTYDAHDGKRLQIAVHIPKLYNLANRTLIWPAPHRERLADHRHMRGIQVVLVAKHTPAHKRNAQGAEIPIRRDTVIRVAHLRRVLTHAAEFLEIRRRFLAVEYQECSVGKIVACRNRKSSTQTHAFSTGNRPKAAQY